MTLRPHLPRTRWRVIAAGVSLVSVLAGGFWFATQFQSVAQQEADAKAPPPGPVFADVARGSLVSGVDFVGQLGPSTQSSVTIPPTPDAALSVVTGHALETGAEVSTGRLLTEVNGRPVFGLHSAFAFYRDMGIGDSGPDVKALQEALAARGYPVEPDGLFGVVTADAVERWYGDAGYGAPTRGAPDVRRSAADAAVDEGSDPGDAASESLETGYVPTSEILAIPTASAAVIQGLRIGQLVGTAGTPDLVLGSADVVVTITVPSTDVGHVATGDVATVFVHGAEVEAVVGEMRAVEQGEVAHDPAAIGDRDDAVPPGSSESAVSFSVIPSEALPITTGRAQVTVTQEVVAADALIVPVLAVSDRGSDKNVVTKRQADGTLLEVAVAVLGTVHGEVAVEPLKRGTLDDGDRVRVG